jgi:hypothetical protein
MFQRHPSKMRTTTTTTPLFPFLISFLFYLGDGGGYHWLYRRRKIVAKGSNWISPNASSPPILKCVFLLFSPLHKRKTRKGIKAFELRCHVFLDFSLGNLFRPSFLESVIEIIQRQLLLPPTPVLCCAMNAERKHFDKFMRMLPAAGIDFR